MITSFKISPRYLGELLKRGKGDPVFITRDTKCLNYIQKLRGTCLFCDKHIDAHKFNLSACYQREIWVLFSDDSYEKNSFELGRAIQLAGANRVLLIPFPITPSTVGE